MKKGFTLIELLTVIAIIAVLSTLLAGVVVKARSSARAAHCRGAQRELCLANQQFAGDAGAYVPAAADLFGANRKRWHGERESRRDAFDGNRSPLAPYLGDTPRSRQCTGFVTRRLKESDHAFELSNGGFGYNAVGVGSLSYSIGFNRESMKRGLKTHMVEAPAALLMFADSAFPQPYRNPDHLIEYSFAEPVYALRSNAPGESGYMNLPSLHFRHDGKVQAAWTDGHVTSERIAPGAPEYPFRTGWFGTLDNSAFRPF